MNCVYSEFFLLGDCTAFVKHLYSSIIQLNFQQNSKELLKNPQNIEISFIQFISSLSIVTRGTLDEKLRWLFHFYDSDYNGEINMEVIII